MDVESALCSQHQISTKKLPAGSFQESKKTTLDSIEDEANKRKLLDDPYQIAKKLELQEQLMRDGRIRTLLCWCNELWAEPLWDYIQWHDESNLFQYAANVRPAMKLLAQSSTMI
ncbi:hypothetical protein GH714_028400 [Hevea brasiliensis]|uniref:Uncharacterized protein n=1 Tax=Hevea brasiliensis TaxID=3981 RepID=A0A6A6LT24_HEVBR|nr:hypothetical protein GH714_028400 [Hevea brasiliensis]